MEINIVNINYNNYKNLSITLKSNKINCIIGDEEKNQIINVFDKEINKYYKNIIINNKSINDINVFKKNIGLVKTSNVFRQLTVFDEIKNYLLNVEYVGDIDKRIEQTLKIVCLDKKQKICNLSISDQIMLSFGKAIAINAKLIIIEDIFYYLDANARNMIVRLMKMLTKKYQRTVLIISNHIDFLYPFVEYYNVIKDNKLLIDGDNDLFIRNYSYLLENQIDIPDLVEFNKRVLKNKGIKLYNRYDIKDLMKDIYRSVV